MSVKRKRVVILGAGISGLATAWYLRQTRELLDIVILEKGTRAGGYLCTDHSTGFHFEKGPRVFRVDSCPHTLKLAVELGLQKEVIWSKVRPHHRYLWHNEELHRCPRSALAFLLSPLTKGFIGAMLTEWKQPAKNQDETVWEFALRRFNYDVARLFFDPIVTGVFGGDMRKISVRACFPLLKAWEEKNGSITKGFLHSLKQQRCGSSCSEVMPEIPMAAVFSFKGGVEQLSRTLAGEMGSCIAYQQEVNRIGFEEGGIQIDTHRGQFSADLLFCALPAREASLLFQPHHPVLSQELARIYSQGVVIVNAGYDAPVLPVEGFGYLTSTYSNEDILGVIFDSLIFTEHNRSREETRLTIKVNETGRSEEEGVNTALRGIRRHLGISRTPKAVHCRKMPRSIPQYRVGHLDKMREIDRLVKKEFPTCYLVGNYLEGVSVEACIARAKKTVQEAFSPG